jgi:adenylate kinase
MLAQREGLEHVSTGEVLRRAISDATPLGVRVKEIVEAGRLVDDATVTALVADRLSRASGVLLDGFPRNVRQAELLEDLLAQRGIPSPRVVEMVVSAEALVERLTGRRTCASCGPRPAGDSEACGACGGPLVIRADDREEVVRERLEVHERETAPLAAWYSQRSLLRRVDGLGAPEEVAERIAVAVAGEGSGP